MNNDILEKGEENSEKNCEKREPKRWSKVWDEFRLIKVGDKKKAICKHCEGCLTGEGSSGTKHLLRHLEKHCKKRPNTDFHSSKHATDDWQKTLLLGREKIKASVAPHSKNKRQVTLQNLREDDVAAKRAHIDKEKKLKRPIEEVALVSKKDILIGENKKLEEALAHAQVEIEKQQKARISAEEQVSSLTGELNALRHAAWGLVERTQLIIENSVQLITENSVQSITENSVQSIKENSVQPITENLVQSITEISVKMETLKLNSMLLQPRNSRESKIYALIKLEEMDEVRRFVRPDKRGLTYCKHSVGLILPAAIKAFMTSRGRSASYLHIDDRFSSRADAWGRSYLVTPNPRVHGTVRCVLTIGFQASFKETKFTSEILPNPMNNLDESSMNPVLRSPSPMNWEMYCELGPILRSPSPKKLGRIL